MNKRDDVYFAWIVDMVNGYRYTNMLHNLYTTEFFALIENDNNRIGDALEFRRSFFGDIYYEDKPCVLEMMVSLAKRCEDQIMSNPKYGDRFNKWFWAMISNLGLLDMTDENYNEEYVDFVMTNFLSRNYERNGAGGLFMIDNFRGDMRNIEIWMQMCNWINSLEEE